MKERLEEAVRITRYRFTVSYRFGAGEGPEEKRMEGARLVDGAGDQDQHLLRISPEGFSWGTQTPSTMPRDTSCVPALESEKLSKPGRFHFQFLGLETEVSK